MPEPSQHAVNTDAAIAHMLLTCRMWKTFELNRNIIWFPAESARLIQPVLHYIHLELLSKGTHGECIERLMRRDKELQTSHTDLLLCDITGRHL